MSQESENTEAQASEEQNQPAAAETTAENLEASEASDAKEGEELEAKDSDDLENKSEKPKAKTPGWEKRIGKLTKRLSEKDQELEYLRGLIQKGQSQANEPKEAPKAEAKPKADDFDSHEAYVEAVADWKVEQRFKAQEAKAKEESLKSDFQKQVETYKEKATAFAKQVPDFEEVVSAVDDIKLSLTVENAVLKHGPELAYELSKDPDELERICSLSPLDAAEAIGEIRARLKGAKADPKPQLKTTNAPKPPTPISSKAAPIRKSITDEDLSFQDFVRLRRDQMRKKG